MAAVKVLVRGPQLSSIFVKQITRATTIIVWGKEALETNRILNKRMPLHLPNGVAAANIIRDHSSLETGPKAGSDRKTGPFSLRQATLARRLRADQAAQALWPIDRPQ